LVFLLPASGCFGFGFVIFCSCWPVFFSYAFVMVSLVFFFFFGFWLLLFLFVGRV
jgi:hypothetical protein